MKQLSASSDPIPQLQSIRQAESEHHCFLCAARPATSYELAWPADIDEKNDIARKSLKARYHTALQLTSSHWPECQGGVPPICCCASDATAELMGQPLVLHSCRKGGEIESGEIGNGLAVTGGCQDVALIIAWSSTTALVKIPWPCASAAKRFPGGTGTTVCLSQRNCQSPGTGQPRRDGRSDSGW